MPGAQIMWFAVVPCSAAGAERGSKDLLLESWGMGWLSRNHMLIPCQDPPMVCKQGPWWGIMGHSQKVAAAFLFPATRAAFCNSPRLRQSCGSHFSEVNYQIQGGEQCSLPPDTGQLVSAGVSLVSKSWFCLQCDALWASTALGKHGFGFPCSPCRAPPASFTCGIQTLLDEV